jgi:low affinity Fe/Cu permease
MQLDIEKRFDRIEQKIDQLSDTVAILARIDERLVSSHKRLDRHEYRINQLEGNIRKVETSIAKSAGKGMVAERAAWIVFAAAITVLAKFL